VRNDPKEDAGRLWARYDSRPLLNAKDPRGSAESDKSSKKWFAEELRSPEKI
jgi:hypothetical protein